VTFTDDLAGIDPFVFEGQAKFVNAGFTAGGQPPEEVNRAMPPFVRRGPTLEFNALRLGGATSIGVGKQP
jgi:hypothetical protein